MPHVGHPHRLPQRLRRRSRKRSPVWTVAAVACLLSNVVAQRPSAADSSVEYELLALINQARSAPLVMHTGLQVITREHSRDMAEADELSHVGANQLMARASPDPPDTKEPPDSGYTGRFCENVGYTGGSSPHGVAQRMYEAWHDSSSHHRCMTSSEMNAAGVGLHFDGSGWWATLELIVDRSPPGSSAQPNPTPPHQQRTRTVVTIHSPAQTAHPPPMVSDVVEVYVPSPTPSLSLSPRTVERKRPARNSSPTGSTAVARPTAGSDGSGPMALAIVSVITALATASGQWKPLRNARRRRRRLPHDLGSTYLRMPALRSRVTWRARRWYRTADQRGRRRSVKSSTSAARRMFPKPSGEGSRRRPGVKRYDAHGRQRSNQERDDRTVERIT